MQINIGQPQETATPQPTQEQGKVVISSNPTKIKIFLDSQGNEIDPRTKQIINQAEKENK